MAWSKKTKQVQRPRPVVGRLQTTFVGSLPLPPPPILLLLLVLLVLRVVDDSAATRVDRLTGEAAKQVSSSLRRNDGPQHVCCLPLPQTSPVDHDPITPYI